MTDCDYNDGKIYLIYLPGLEEYGYIGSTVQTLEQRMKRHKYQKESKQPYQFASCVFFQDENEVCIKLLEDYPCNTKQELLEREKYWLDEFPDAVNKNPPILSEEDRLMRSREISLRCYYAKQEQNIARNRAYKAAHKDELSEKQSAKRASNIDAARAKDKLSNQNRDKEKRKEWKNKKVVCEKCEMILSRNNFSTHKKNKHPDEDVSYKEH